MYSIEVWGSFLSYFEWLARLGGDMTGRSPTTPAGIAI
jgi:hypothetical protein